MKSDGQQMAIQAQVDEVRILKTPEPGSPFQIGIWLTNIDDPRWFEVFAFSADEARRLTDGVNRAFETIRGLQAQN